MPFYVELKPVETQSEAARSFGMNALEELRLVRDRVVTDYEGGTTVIERANELTEEIAAFPGGTGLIAGEPGTRRLMVLLHNWDGTDNAHKSSDYDSSYWETLRLFIAGSGVGDGGVFVTNLLMGLKPGASGSNMSQYCSNEFLKQCIGYLNKDTGGECIGFLDEQVRIVQPEVVAVCGDEARDLLKQFRPGWHPKSGKRVNIAHPSGIQGDYVRAKWSLKSVNKVRKALGLALLTVKELGEIDRRVNSKVYARRPSQA